MNDDCDIKERLGIALETVLYNKRVLEKAAALYRHRICDAGQVRVAIAATRVSIEATRRLKKQYIRITERRLF